MKLNEDYQTYEVGIISIKSAIYLEDYSIKIIFSDGVENVIDFKPFLSQSIHPSIKKYLNKDLFVNFKIVNGNLNWNDYDLIFPISELYDGAIKL